MRLALLLLAGLLAGCRPEVDRPVAAQAPVEDIFDEAGARGLDYVNRSGEARKPTILEANGAGVAVIDLGNDGDLDLVFAQGLGSLAQLRSGPGADLEVFENDGTGHFRRVSGPGLSGGWTGLAVGDVDNDGDEDLVAAGFGALVLLRQQDGKLVPDPAAGLATSSPSDWLVPGAPREVGHPPLWPTSLALFDADRDGALDLFVVQYVDLDPLAPPLGKLGEGPLAVPCLWKGHEVFCGPRGFLAQPDRLLRGDGQGHFVDQESLWLGAQKASYGLGVAAFDADGDGDTDLFVANDSTPNQLWINDGALEGKTHFTDRAREVDVALSVDGRMQAGMGVTFGDVDRDGRMDFAVNNFSDEPTELYCGSERGFRRETHRMGLGAQTRALLGWSAHLVDFDGDGWLELFSTNGHVYPQADDPLSGTSYGQPAALWRLGPEKRARRVEARDPRSILAPPLGARGAALADFDGDGRLDAVLARIDGPAALGMNRLAPDNGRLMLRLLGNPELLAARKSGERATPLDGHGARAALVVGSGTNERGLLGEVESASGYQSSSTLWLSFGLGREKGYTALRVVWPSGRVDSLPGGAANRRLTLVEGRGIVKDEAFR
ncbi:MAG: CRTAC1 family protein [Planctomycetes bacterium]|nr:CRTAC1 family protein [Planctomycetota bacterium]